MPTILRVLISALLMLAPGAASRAGLDVEAPAGPERIYELIVVEADGCIYCQIFRRDVLPAYRVSEQGRKMPVRFVDINELGPGLDFNTAVDIVPTFVVVKSQHEVGRISGYVGPENFFHTINYLLGSAP
ncbi:hypothetical protein [Hyphomicrobium sp.]|uniref:hypothetical protein n=1 Tax=Hyphomicrobium sp. TaxID=82 RepID=UPI002D77B5EA|nr:hypothetical protein [Hyphomicrobium sp.]HET6388635.1 hypothetical protein [Hyphomicrobium sp.]